MPTPQENSLFAKQAGKPVLENGGISQIKLTSCTIVNKFLWAGRMPTPQENSLFASQASCLFIKMLQYLRLKRPIY
jgi:hypothetical protein